MPTRVLVTPRSLTRAGLDAAPTLAPLRDAGLELVAGPAGRQPTHDELLALVPGCTGWIAGVEPVDAEVLASATRLRVISRWGVGTDAFGSPSAAAAAMPPFSTIVGRTPNSEGCHSTRSAIFPGSTEPISCSSPCAIAGQIVYFAT